MQEEARAEVIHPSKSRKSVQFRLFGWQLKSVLKTLGAAMLNPDALEDWNAWKPKPVQMIVDNGRGMEGDCGFHRYAHISIFPLASSPPKCYEATLLAKPLKEVQEDWAKVNKNGAGLRQ